MGIWSSSARTPRVSAKCQVEQSFQRICHIGSVVPYDWLQKWVFFVVKMQQCKSGFLERARPRRSSSFRGCGNTSTCCTPTMPLRPCFWVMNTLMLVKRLFVRVLIPAQWTSFLDLQMDNFDMSFENNQMLESVSASGTSMRTFSHVIDCKDWFCSA